MPKVKQRKLTAIRANVGLEVGFQKKIDALLEEMQNSLIYWLSSAYKANEPATLAQDASAASVLDVIIKRLTRKWTRKFNDAAHPLADYYAKSAKDYTDSSLRAALKKAGMTVEFKITPAIQDILTASVNENVILIKTLAQEHLADVNQMVMRSVSAGRDLGHLREELQKRYGITKKRARLIARTSNDQTTAMLTRARQMELGITKAIWYHSHAGKTQRPSHVAMDGKEYDVATGAFLDGEFTYPGYLWNCKCYSNSILPPLQREIDAGTRTRD